MSINQSEVERLRKLFAEEPDGTNAGEGCGSPEEIWEAVRGNLPKERLGELVDHTVHCPDCAEEWRLAVELNREEVAGQELVAPQSQRFSWRTPLALAASLLVLVLGWSTSSLLQTSPPGFRGSDRPLTSPVDGQSLPREQFVLRWEEGPSGSKYNLLATRDDLSVITRAEALSANSFQIPSSDLADIPSGSSILWQVEIVLPDGTKVGPERTFLTTLR